jgi:hypothetical protein
MRNKSAAVTPLATARIRRDLSTGFSTMQVPLLQ